MRGNGSSIPIFIVPTTYGTTREKVFAEAGINGIVYANHLLRAAYPRMVRAACHILKEERSDDETMQEMLATTTEVLSLIPVLK
jgi:phosphoenolpyruvate phosphomutase / 2-hydroxyethylphosphonate cytidylyltransferase